MELRNALTARRASQCSTEQLMYSDTTNKVIGPLAYTPKTLSATVLTIPDGCPQEYTQDYTVRNVSGGSAPGRYICVSSTSSAPGGGNFSGGSNPTVGIDTVLESGDYVWVIHPY